MNLGLGNAPDLPKRLEMLWGIHVALNGASFDALAVGQLDVVVKARQRFGSEPEKKRTPPSAQNVPCFYILFVAVVRSRRGGTREVEPGRRARGGGTEFTLNGPSLPGNSRREICHKNSLNVSISSGFEPLQLKRYQNL